MTNNDIIDYAKEFLGRPYIWGGDGTGAKAFGFDCSGLVLECLWAFGLYSGADTTADGLCKALKKAGWKSVDLDKSEAGDVVFFGTSSKMTHTAIAIGDGLMIEAGGGSSKCTTAAISTGMVRIRPLSRRKDLRAVLRRP